MKNSRKLIVSSLIMILSCCLLFAGTTFAWFSDSVTSANNTITAGNLDVELDYWNGSDWTTVEGKSDILTNELWEPGVVEVAYLRLENAGSLSLLCQFGINIVSEKEGKDQKGNEFKLSDYIYFDMKELSVSEENPFKPYATRKDAMEIATQTTLISEGHNDTFAMSSNEVHYYALVVYMPETIGNEANHNGVDIPEIKLGIKASAMQYTKEHDSFDEYYDSLATDENGLHHLKDQTLSSGSDENGNVEMINGALTFKVKTQVADGNTVVASISSTNANPASVAMAENLESEILSYDIKVEGQKDDAEVVVEIFVGKSLQGLYVYQGGNPLIYGEQYSYDASAGFVTINMANSLNSRSAVSTTFDIMYGGNSVLTSYEHISSVKGSDGSHILGADFTAENIIHFGTAKVSLDLNGKTITAGKIDQYSIGAQYGSILTINGNGVVNAGKGFMTNKDGATIIINGGTYNTTVTGKLNNIQHASLAQNDSKIIINGGTFTTNVEDAVLFYATSNSTIEINGGFFENTADETPDLLSMGINSSNTNRIILKGGTFVNWNPLNDRMMYTGEWPADEAAFVGPWMLIPVEYKVVSETQANGDIWYSVVHK